MCLSSFLFWVLTFEMQNFCGCLFQFVLAMMLLRALSKNPVPLSGKHACYSPVFSLVVLVLVFRWFDPPQMKHWYADLFIIAVSVGCVGSGCCWYSCWGQRTACGICSFLPPWFWGSNSSWWVGATRILSGEPSHWPCKSIFMWCEVSVRIFFRSSCKSAFSPELLRCPDWNQVTRAWLCLYSVHVSSSSYLSSKKTTLHYGWDLHYVFK